MGLPTRLSLVRFGLHSSGTSWSDVPGTLYSLEPQSGWELSTDFEETPRDFEREDGKLYVALNGSRMSSISVSTPIYGLSGGGAGSNVNASSLGVSPVDQMLTSMMMGTDSVDETEGELSHSTNAGTGTGLVLAASATDMTVDSAILVQSETSAEYQVRYVTASSGANITMCRALTSSLGVTDTPEESTVVYGSRNWHMAYDANYHIHGFFDAEGSNWRRRLYGCMGSATIDITAGGVVQLASKWDASTWEDTAEGTSFSAPTVGGHVRGIRAQVWLGSTLYMATDVKLDLGIAYEPRASWGAPDGKFGFVVTQKSPKVTMRLHSGSSTAPAEVTDAQLGTWQGNNTATPSAVDVLVQVGRTPGATMAFRMPAADVRAKRIRSGGQDMIDLTASATRVASGYDFVISTL